MIRIIALSLFWTLTASPVHAAAIVGAIIAGTAVTSAMVIQTVAQIGVSVAIAAYQQRRLQKQMESASQAQAPGLTGVTTQYTGSGGTTPLTMVVGRYATAGHFEAPPVSFPQDHAGLGLFGVSRYTFLTYVIGLGDCANIRLTGRVVINDVWYTLTNSSFTKNKRTGGVLEDQASLPLFGATPSEGLTDYCWFITRSGLENTADPFLRYWLDDHPQRPWLADMIGRGVPHVIATFQRDAERFPSDPKLRFEVLGIPLYDPRKDSSVGGVGDQRWGSPSTWAFTENPKVIEYNIHRGIVVEGYGIWGNKVAAADLPLDNWFAAMNACDVLVDNGKGGSEPSYVFGYEFGLDTSPAKIIDEINRSCAGETVEIGGIYKTRVGGVGLPVYFFTDDDVLVTRRQELEPFVGLEQTFNALSCSFVDPDLLWQSREAPPLTNATWEADDGQLEYDEDLGGFARRPRRLLKQIGLPAVSSAAQVQRLMASALREGRNRRSHVLTLPPEALKLEPLDAVSWTSLHNGFVGKIFDVVMTVDPVTELRPRIALQEADPADYTVPEYQSFETPTLGGGATNVLAAPGIPVPSERLYLTRPGSGLKVALRLVASPSQSLDVRGYQWQRLEGDVWRDLLRSSEPDIELADANLGPWAVRVRAEGALGSLSAWATQEFEVQGLAIAPSALTNVSLQSAGGLALLSWEPHPDLDVQEGGAIVVRYSAHPVPSWENSHTGWRTFGRNTSIIVPLMQGTYLLRAEDAGGVGGPIIALGTDGVQAIGFISAGLLQEDDDFSGVHDGTRTEGGALYLTSALMFDDVIDEALDALDWDYAGGVLTSGIYNFATVLDVGTPKRLRLRTHVVQEPVNMIDDFDGTPGMVDDSADWDGTLGAECSVAVEVQLTQTDPSATPVWGDWQTIQSSEMTARGLRARARLTSNSSSFTPQVTELRLIIDEVA